MTTRQEKRIRRKQLIIQLERLETQHRLIDGQLSCGKCDICKQIRAVGNQIAPMNVDVCTDAGLTVEDYYEMREKGMTDREIAISLMVAPTSVKNWKAKNKIITRRKNKAFDVPIEQYTNLRDQGLTNQEIRKEFNCSIRTLDRWIARNNLNDIKKAVKS